jgi:hypothetical protein
VTFACAAGRCVTPYNDWLAVIEDHGKVHHYLGWRTFQPTSTALSPGGRRLAWIDPSSGTLELVVEDLTTGQDTKVTTPRQAIVSVEFADDDRLLVGEQSGGLLLMEWRTGKVIATADSGPFFQTEVDPTRGLVHVTTSTSASLFYEIGPSGFSPPYVLPQGLTRAGFLAGKAPDDPAIWVTDSEMKVRSLTLAELRKGVSLSAVDKLKPISDVQNALTVDALAHVYSMAPTADAVLVDGRPFLTRWTSDVGLVPAPGATVMALTRPDGVIRLVSTSGATVASLVAAPGARLAWSADGSRLAASGIGGTIVVDTKDGHTVFRRCSLDFVREDVAPPLVANQGVTICEQ